MKTWNFELEDLLAGLLWNPEEEDPGLAWDWDDPLPFRIGVGPAECDNATLVDIPRETPRRYVVDTHQLQRWMAERPVVIFDVRTAGEYAAGHIPEARHTEPEVVAEAVAQQPPETLAVLVCRSGRRSGELVQKLAGLGGCRIYHLQGGMLVWTGSVV
ncbi:MAG: rhodanese-like domain-containing protein [Thermaerobacter sp.]|nr:rhodanese-like domain-containing protein [Thermaerobacter sp.]